MNLSIYVKILLLLGLAYSAANPTFGFGSRTIADYPLTHSPDDRHSSAGITLGDLILGPGVIPVSVRDALGARGWNRTRPSLSNSIRTGAYFQISLIVERGYEISLESLCFVLRRSGANAPRYFDVHVSLDDFTQQSFSVGSFSMTSSGGDGEKIGPIALGEFSTLQNIGGPQSVTFRIFAWGDASTGAQNNLALGRKKGPRINGSARLDETLSPSLARAVNAVLADGGTGVTAKGSEEATVRLLFMEPGDVFTPWGKLAFRTNAIKHQGRARTNQGSGVPTFHHALSSEPERDGWWLYGIRSQENGWSLVRFHTRDGLLFEDEEEVFKESQNRPWLGHSAITRNEKSGKMVMLRTSRPDSGERLAYYIWAYGSHDGSNWHLLKDEPVFADHEVFGLVWNRDTGEYISLQTTYQDWDKKYPDNLGGNTRRVLHLRRSVDGRTWFPDTKVGDARSGYTRAPAENLMVPDSLDPDELEFYAMQGFYYNDRYIAMVLNYAPSPQSVNPNAVRGVLHGPHLYAEWWTGDSATKWRRPYRGQHATNFATIVPWKRITHSPILVDEELRFIVGSNVYSVDVDRFAGIYSHANGEFSTESFIMPRKPLKINADVAWLDEPLRHRYHSYQQNYVMAELLLADGRAIPGYERNKMIVSGRDVKRLQMTWDGRTGVELAGIPVRLRFYFRGATIYSVASTGSRPTIH